MKNKKNTYLPSYRLPAFYLVLIGSFFLLAIWTLDKGRKLEIGKNLEQNVTELQSTFWIELWTNLTTPLALLMIQIVTIIIILRGVTYLFRKMGQPGVMGEITAGILLGPSFLGIYFPDISNALFPAKSLVNLNLLSFLGMILFMFMVGMELDFKLLRTKLKDAFLISHVSIIVPFSLGLGLAYFLYEEFGPSHVDFLSFALFLGVSLSITAFPVLAKILQEKNMFSTTLGTLIIACAAIDDISAWIILTAIIAIIKSGPNLGFLYTILLTAVYVVVMMKVVKPLLERVSASSNNNSEISKSFVGLVFIVLLISSYITEAIGLHALFGAFMAGLVMPSRQNIKPILTKNLDNVTTVLLLPIFFVLTGLRTHINLLDTSWLWVVCGIVIILAILGKLIGSAIAARFVGHSLKDSLVIGTYMNTRGLMELVVLNIGFDLGILTPVVFTIMVIMAVVTTFLTGPLLNLIDASKKRSRSL